MKTISSIVELQALDDRHGIFQPVDVAVNHVNIDFRRVAPYTPTGLKMLDWSPT